MRAPDSKSWAEGRTAGCPGNSTTDVGFRACRSTQHRTQAPGNVVRTRSEQPPLGALRETTSKDRFRRALLLMKPAHTGHHPGAVPGFRPSPGNSEETTTRVLTEEISVLFRVPTWDPTHPGSPVSRALPGNTPTQGPTREGKPGFFLGGGGNPGRNPGHGLGKTRERGGFRVFPGWYCWGL